MKKEETRLTVIVQPNAGRNQIKDYREGILYLKIAAPPTEGKANRELVGYLGEILGIAKSRISVEKGLRAKKKLISIGGMSPGQISELISGLDIG